MRQECCTLSVFLRARISFSYCLICSSFISTPNLSSTSLHLLVGTAPLHPPLTCIDASQPVHDVEQLLDALIQAHILTAFDHELASTQVAEAGNPGMSVEPERVLTLVLLSGCRGLPGSSKFIFREGNDVMTWDRCLGLRRKESNASN